MYDKTATHLIIIIISGALETVPKGLEKDLKELEIRRKIETILHNLLLRSTRILTRAMETCGDLLSLRVL